MEKGEKLALVSRERESERERTAEIAPTGPSSVESTAEERERDSSSSILR